jgi:predicted ArsR family transcriptional regulator
VAGTKRGWTFLTNHGHVFIAVNAAPDALMKDIAKEVGITERAAQMILADLVADGYIEVTRVGRRNHYKVNPDTYFRHPNEATQQVGMLLNIFSQTKVEA